MKYAASTVDGTVHIITTAPATVTVGGEEFRVSGFERLSNHMYKIVYYSEEHGSMKTVTCDSRGKNGQAVIKFHSVDKALDSLGAVTEVVPITDESALSDRTFRNAWALVNSAVTTDMTKAREIHKEHLRAARKPKLEQADIDYYRALEAAVVTGLAPETPEYVALEEIAARKKALRDVPQDPGIEAAQTPEELKAVWPPALI